jgi:hypothetical protein
MTVDSLPSSGVDHKPLTMDEPAPTPQLSLALAQPLV